MRLVHHHQSDVFELLVATADQRLLRRDDDLRAPPLVLLGAVVGHLQTRSQTNHIADLVHGLPDEFTERGDDQRAAGNSSSQFAEDDRLPRPGEHARERRTNPVRECPQMGVNDLRLVVA